jgi:Domain of unknown function (DUF4190)
MGFPNEPTDQGQPGNFGDQPTIGRESGGPGQPGGGYGQQGGTEPGAYGQPGDYGQPGSYGQPGGYPQPGAYGQPGGYPQPGAYGQPGPYPQPGAYGQPGGYPQPGYQGAPTWTGGPGYPAGQGTSGLAVAALVCGIAQIFFWVLAGIPAIILGHVARSRIRQTGEQGAGMALAGLILGYVGLALAIIFVILIIAVGSSVQTGNGVNPGTG